MNTPMGLPPSKKYLELLPHYPITQRVLYGAMAGRGYVTHALDAQLDLSARNSKQLIMLDPTGDIDSLLVDFSSWNPTFNAAATPRTSRKLTQNAGNLPNPTGLDGNNVNSLQ